MKRTMHFIAAGLTVLATTAVAMDEFVLPSSMDDIERFRNVSGWTVYQDKTSKSCFFSREDKENGAVVQMGLTKSSALGYIGLFSKDFEVEEGLVDAAMVMNDIVYTGQIKRVTKTVGGYQGGYIVGFTEDLRKALNTSAEIVVFPDAPYMYKIDLDGVKNAVYETRRCMEDLNE